MARYIDADELLKELQEELDFETPMYTEEQNKYFNSGLRCAIRDVKKAPTADVVPKSEVDRLQQVLDSKCDNCICLARQMLEEKTAQEIQTLRVRYLKRIDEAKQEVAREIFEEIDRIVSEYCDRFIPPTEMVAMLFDLKKKYTKSEGSDTLNNTKN